MACALSSGYTLDCKDSAGGISDVYFIELNNITTIGTASGVVTGITKATGKRFWRYQLPKETGYFNETITGNTQNGTVFYAQEVKVIVNKLNTTVRNEIQNLAQNTLIAVVKDMNGKYWMAGKERGIDLNNGVSGTGTAFGDRSGYDLTFTGSEPDPMFEVEASVAAALETQG